MAREEVVYESVIARLMGRKTIIRFEDENEDGSANSVVEKAGPSGLKKEDDFADLMDEFDSPVFAKYRETKEKK